MPHKDPQKKKLYLALYYQNNKEKIRQYFKEWELKNPFYHVARATLYKHKKYKNCIVKDVSTKWLMDKFKDTPYCEICGVLLDYSKKGKLVSNSPSLDRLNNEKEIRKDNIQILCHRCNSTKGDKNIKDLVSWCKLVIQKYAVI